MSCTQIWPPRYSLNTEHQRVLLLQSLYWSILLCLVAELCLALCNPMDCRAPGSSIHGISKQEYWSVLPFPSPGDLPDPGIKPASPALVGAHSSSYSIFTSFLQDFVQNATLSEAYSLTVLLKIITSSNLVAFPLLLMQCCLPIALIITI